MVKILHVAFIVCIETKCVKRWEEGQHYLGKGKNKQKLTVSDQKQDIKHCSKASFRSL